MSTTCFSCHRNTPDIWFTACKKKSNDMFVILTLSPPTIMQIFPLCLIFIIYCMLMHIFIQIFQYVACHAGSLVWFEYIGIFFCFYIQQRCFIFLSHTLHCSTSGVEVWKSFVEVIDLVCTAYIFFKGMNE